MTWLNAKYGLAFHWLPILFQKMDLPVYTGVEEALKLFNTKRMEALEYAKTSRGKQERKRWKFKRKVLEKCKREQWSKAHGNHDYLGSDGGLDNIRRPSRQEATKLSKPPSDDEGDIDGYSDMYESESDSDMNIEEMMYERCYCPNYPSHLRTCPFNIKQMSRVLDFGTNCDSTLEAATKLEAEDNEREGDSNTRNSGMKNNAEKKPCKCGAVSHTHKDCPSKRSPLRQEKLINNVTTEDIFVISPPPTDEWMSQAAAVIQTFSGCRRVSLRKDRICRVNCPEISPHIRCSIQGDGNCLFRALSRAITGTESNHFSLRLAICEYMIHKDNAVDFYNIYNNQATVDEAVSALKKYLADSKMRSIGSWGTERELEVAAVMFQVDIFVFCQYGRDCAWALTRPTFVRNNGMSRSNVKLYIYHSHGHYDLVLPISD